MKFFIAPLIVAATLSIAAHAQESTAPAPSPWTEIATTGTPQASAAEYVLTLVARDDF